LKAHYPAEFMASLLTADQENTDRIVIDVSECELMGIKILPPNINESYEGFTVISDDTIRYGLSAVKNLGKDTIDQILQARKKSPFKNLADLIHRIPAKSVNKKSFEALIMSGALDEFGERNALMNSVDIITGYAKQHSKGQNDDQTDLFGMLSEQGEEHPFELNKAEVASWFQRLQWEKEALGMYVSDHPLRGLRQYMRRKVTLIGTLKASMADRELTIGGIVNNFRKITTKRGDTMVIFEMEDLTGKINVVVFPRVYESIKDTDFFTDHSNFVMVKGKVDYRAGELQLSARSVSKSSIKAMRENAMEQKMYDPKEPRYTEEEINLSNEKMEAEEMSPPPTNGLYFSLKNSVGVQDLKTIKTLLEKHPGEKPVVLNILVDGKRQDVPTGLLVEDNASLRSDLEPYLK
jgi:DNA polymerase-3 subunit alpha